MAGEEAWLSEVQDACWVDTRKRYHESHWPDPAYASSVLPVVLLELSLTDFESLPNLKRRKVGACDAWCDGVRGDGHQQE